MGNGDFEFWNGLPAIELCFKTVTNLRINCQFLSKFKMHTLFNPETSLLGLCPTGMHKIMSQKCMKKDDFGNVT